jgi:hypothetical protein
LQSAKTSYNHPAGSRWGGRHAYRSNWLVDRGSGAVRLRSEGEGIGGSSPRAQGRYSGIGIFETDRLWKKSGVAEPKDPAAARLADDTAVIVVIDSHTGEVRQCGNNSGYCVTMNPWAEPGQRTAAPVKLTKHAADLDVAREQATAETPPAR